MISWIQRTFQHHFRIVFGVMLAILIISFIMTIGAAPGIGRSSDRIVTQDFFGHNLVTDMTRLTEDAYISIVLQIGSPGGIDPAEVQKYALRRVAALHLADQLHIPAPTPGEVADFIKTLRPFQGSDGKFDPVIYGAFRANLQNNSLGSEADFARVIREDLRSFKVQALLDGPGYVLPADVKTQLAQSDTTWTIATAAVDYKSFHPVITPTDSELAKFFQENDFRYQIPPRVIASYISFPASKFMGGATGTDAAKKLASAQSAAVKAASDVAYDLYSNKVAEGAGLASYLAAHNLDLKPLAPFTHDAGPAELGGGSEIADAAFRLNSDRYFSEALSVPSGAAILIWSGTQPAHNPLLLEVRDKVRDDFIENEKRVQFAALGRTLKSRIEARLKSGEPFAKAVAAAAGGDAKVEVKTLPAFTLLTRPKDLNETETSAFTHLEKGQVSDMAMTADKGYFVYAIDKKTPDLTEANPRYAETRAQLAAYTARLASREYLAQIVDDEQKRTAPAVK